MKSTTAVGTARANYNGYTATRPAILGLAKVLFLGLCQLSHVSAAPVRTYLGFATEDDLEGPQDPSLWLYLGIASILVLLGGAFAGLTIALMGQDGVYLQVIATSGEGKEQRHAEKVFKLLQRGKHWVLVTLLLGNVIVNETLPIVLDRSLGGGWPAVLGSTGLIVIFGEIIPQSVCVRYGLSIGAYMAPFVLALMWILAPIAWPTAKLLDKLLGEDHGTVYKKSGLKTLVTLHKTLGTSPGDRLNQDEVTIISAVLDLKDKAVGDIMTPMEDVFTMSADAVLDEKTMDTILTAGYSRIPIYEPGNRYNFVGMLLVKILITYDPEDCKRVNEFALATLPETRPETSCLDIVNFFQEGKSHMVLVSEYPGENYGATGVVTLEDVMEELIGEEIIDESDVYIDVHKAIRRMAPAPKARIQKGHIVGNPDNGAIQAPEDHLINLTEERPNAIDMAKRTLSCENDRSHSPVSFSTSPKMTFVRRSSSGADRSTVAVRGNFDEMREYLKHLGPSNLASRPKSTRYNTVKIKPGHPANVTDSRTDSTLHRSSITEEPYHDEPELVAPAPQGGEEEGLLISAGKDAKDSVQALQQGYGSFSRSSNPQRPSQTSTEIQPQLDESTTDPRKSWGSQFNRHQSPARKFDSLDSSESSDTLGSLHSKDGRPAHRKRGVARSGSITENIVDAGGVRKVVLETHSSDDNDFKAQDDSTFGNSSTRQRWKTSPEPDDQINTNEEPKEDVKKKQKRRRKRKGGKPGEDVSSTGGSAVQ